MKYEILDQSTVTNIIVADIDFMQATYPQGNYREVPDVEPLVNTPRNITVGAFFDRFGENKWGILADTNPLVQALVKDCSVRKFINLDDSQLIGGLNLLVNAGHAINTTSIINADISPSEQP